MFDHLHQIAPARTPPSWCSSQLLRRAQFGRTQTPSSIFFLDTIGSRPLSMRARLEPGQLHWRKGRPESEKSAYSVSMFYSCFYLYQNLNKARRSAECHHRYGGSSQTETDDCGGGNPGPSGGQQDLKHTSMLWHGPRFFIYLRSNLNSCIWKQ